MEEYDILIVRWVFDFFVSIKSLVLSGFVYYIEFIIVSVKLLGYKVRMFLDIELEFILLEEEERDYMIMEIDLSKEVAFLFGLEDIEFFSDKDDSFLVFLKNFCNVKE